MSVLVGRVGLVVKGAWDSSVAYAAMDVVTYNNSTYIAKQAVPAGTLPTNTTYWELSLDASLLQPKTMSSPVTIGGESKTTVEAAVGALEDVKADKTAISSVETTNTAVSAHAVGSYFINASGQFVKTTSAIAIGDTIIVKPTVGYNCEATTVGDILEALNSKTISLTSRTRRDITNDLANLSQAVSEQNLEKYGYKIGDYFTGTSGYTYILADLNPFKGTGTPYCISTEHLGIVVDTHATSIWNTSSALDVGYAGSTLQTYLSGTVLNNIKSDFIALFGGSTGLEHLKSNSKLYYDYTSHWGWAENQYISALTCRQIDTGNQWNFDPYQEGESSKSLELFRRYKWTEIMGNEYFWLRNLQCLFFVGW